MKKIKNNNLVRLSLFGELAEFIGAGDWEFNVNSVQECLKALNTVTNNKFNEYFIKNNKLQAKYRILINGRDFYCTENELNENNWEKFQESELVMQKNDLKTIDIVPLIESAGNIGGIIASILGIILLVIGVILLIVPGTQGIGYGLLVAGISLLGAGVVALLSKPPSFDFNQNLDNSISQSYLFNGPTNTVGEGNPVPIGYGTTLVGSNVISAGYQITQFETANL